MGNPNVRPSDQVTIVGKIDPDAASASTVTTGWIAAKDYASFLAIIQAGDLGASATLDAKLQQASDSSGTGAKDISGKSITQLTQAGTDSDKQALINLRPEELDLDNNFTHFRLSMTVATAASEIAAIVLGLHARYQPASHVSTVDEVIS
jgi:hypothetical protein